MLYSKNTTIEKCSMTDQMLELARLRCIFLIPQWWSNKSAYPTLWTAAYFFPPTVWLNFHHPIKDLWPFSKAQHGFNITNDCVHNINGHITKYNLGCFNKHQHEYKLHILHCQTTKMWGWFVRMIRVPNIFFFATIFCT